jgi:predicted nucleotidyltransferase
VSDSLAPEDVEQIEAIVGIASEALGEKLVGAYLFGSATLGGLKPSSDVDVLAVVREPTTIEERRAVMTRLPSISGSPEPRTRWRPVELTIVVRDAVVPWRYPPMRELQYGEWLRADSLAGVVPDPVPDPDLGLILTEVLHADRPLLGPRPAEVLDPVPFADVRRATLDCVPGLVNDIEGDTRNVLLTFARVWYTLATGEIQSKDVTAAWAMEQLPGSGGSRAVLAEARTMYLEGRHGERGWPGREAGVREAVEAMSAAIEGLR